MSDAAPNAFHKVISDRHFFTKTMLPATLCAVLAALLVPCIAFTAGALSQLIVSRSLSVESQASITSVERGLAKLADRSPWLQSSASALTLLFGLVVACIILRFLLRAYIRNAVARQVSTSVARLREHIQRHALRCNPGDLTGSQQVRAAGLFRDTARQLEQCAGDWGFRRLTRFADLLAIGLALLLVQWRVGLECILPVIVCWFVARFESDRHAASTDLLEEQVHRELEKLTDHLQKSQIVAAYSMESLEHSQFSQALTLYGSRHQTLRSLKQRGRWASTVIVIAMIALPAFILCRHLLFGKLVALPSAVTIATLTGFCILSLFRLQNLPQLRGLATVAAENINQYLLRVPAVSQVVGARFLEPMSRLLQFNQVSMEVDSPAELLTNLDLKIEAGQRVALLSLNPLEARALVALIPRFADPSSGQVLIDGQDIRRVTLESLRAEAVIVGGNEPLFNATVLDNIIAGQSGITRQDAIEACKIAHVESIIRQLPKGYETHLEENQTLLNPGRRFRLSLARAIARNPALLVIEEPGEMLDTETKAMLDDTYERLCKDRTVIFLPTRLSTVKKCQRVVVLHNGRVAADGQHEELVRSSELYRHWEYVRFNVFR